MVPAKSSAPAKSLASYSCAPSQPRIAAGTAVVVSRAELDRADVAAAIDEAGYELES